MNLLFATTLALVIEAAVALAVDLVLDLVLVLDLDLVLDLVVVVAVAVALALSIALVSLGHRKTVEGGGLWVHGTLSAMDGATELTGTYLQRVP